jgi:hypothetical protein
MSDIQYGFVAMLDVLGASLYDIQSAQQFIVNRDELLEELNSIESELSDFEDSLPSPRITTFGDTIVFTWAVGPERIMKALYGVGEWLRASVRWGIAHGMLLRGALSVGEFISEESTILGPAVADCASWYEAANWFGVILTPSAGLHMTSLAESSTRIDALKSINYMKWFVEYDVPLKGGKQIMWASSWPFDTWANHREGQVTPLEALTVLLWELPIPKGTESKCSNSIEFFKWFGHNITTKINLSHNNN